MSVLLLLLVAAAGAGLLRCVVGPPSDLPARVAEWSGGFLIGFLLLGATLIPAGEATLASAHAMGLAGVVTVALASWGWAVARPSRGVVDAPTTAAGSGAGSRVVFAGCVLLLVGLALAMAVQVAALPTLPWDGWNAWLAKVRIWSEAGSLVPTVTTGEWLHAAAGTAHAVAGAPYPEALPRAVAWLLGGQAGWNESRAHLPWFALWLALAGLSFGGLARLGVSRAWALAGSAALMSLPLVSAHAALSGYADLWLAAIVLLAVLELLAWQRSRRPGHLLLLGLALVLMPLVKLEGAVYALLLGLATIAWLLPVAVRWAVLAAAALLLPWIAAGGSVALPVPGLGWVELKWGEVSLPVVGTLTLQWRDVGSAVLNALFVLPGFSMLWYFAVLVPLLRWRRLADPALAPAMAFLFAAAGFHFVLFFLTDASAWAENLTSLNRLLLHTVPAWVALITLLLAPPQGLPARRYGRFARSPR